MTKQEFEQRLGWAVSENEYRKIETVYTFHPSISETAGKDQITYLYKTFGMRIIEDMLPTATNASALQDKIRDAKIRLDLLMNEYKALSLK
jgi:hypothetical protein